MNTKIIAGLGIGAMLLGAAPMAFAHENENEGAGVGVAAQANMTAGADAHTDNGLHLGQFIGLHLGANKHQDNENDGDKDDNASTTHKGGEREGHQGILSHVAGGAVTSVSGNTFTLGGKSTTTVTINGNTQIVSRDGATTTAAITTGAHVIVFGSTTATSTSGVSFTANVVIVLGKAWGGLRHFFHF